MKEDVVQCPYCMNKLQDISSMHENKIKVFRCINQRCSEANRFYDENGKHPACSICGSTLWEIDHVLPDIAVDLNDDGHLKWVCRNCAMGIMLLPVKK